MSEAKQTKQIYLHDNCYSFTLLKFKLKRVLKGLKRALLEKMLVKRKHKAVKRLLLRKMLVKKKDKAVS